jgi:hypothetical protein
MSPTLWAWLLLARIPNAENLQHLSAHMSAFPLTAMKSDERMIAYRDHALKGRLSVPFN